MKQKERYLVDTSCLGMIYYLIKNIGMLSVFTFLSIIISFCSGDVLSLKKDMIYILSVADDDETAVFCPTIDDFQLYCVAMVSREFE